MKKLSLLFMAVAFLCPKVANAQDGKGSINFVPYVGVNYSDFSGDDDYFFAGTSGKVSFMAGASFEFIQSDKWSLLIDYNYRRLGAIADNCVSVYRTYDAIEPYTKHYKKITLDCHTFGIQYKHEIVNGLSARIGLEGTFSAAEYWYYNLTGKIAHIKSGSVVAAAIFHGSFNAFASLGVLFLDHTDELLTAPMGLAGMVVFLMTLGALHLTDRSVLLSTIKE